MGNCQAHADVNVDVDSSCVKHIRVSSESFPEGLRAALSAVTVRYLKYCSPPQFMDVPCLCDLGGVLALILKITFAKLCCKATCKNSSNTEGMVLNAII